MTIGAVAIAGVLVVNGAWAVWEDGFDRDATLRLGLGTIACVVAMLIVFALAR